MEYYELLAESRKECANLAASINVIDEEINTLEQRIDVLKRKRSAEFVRGVAADSAVKTLEKLAEPEPKPEAKKTEDEPKS